MKSLLKVVIGSAVVALSMFAGSPGGSNEAQARPYYGRPVARAYARSYARPFYGYAPRYNAYYGNPYRYGNGYGYGYGGYRGYGYPRAGVGIRVW